MTAADSRMSQLIADLSEIYGWSLNTTQALNLRSAFRGKNGEEISTTAGLAAGKARTLTPEALCRALANGVTPGDRPKGVPWHTPDCQCGGDGTVAGSIDVVRGRGNHERLVPHSTLGHCPANQGRPITVEQWERWQNTNRIKDRNDVSPMQRSLAAVRAIRRDHGIERPTNDGDDAA